MTEREITKNTIKGLLLETNRPGMQELLNHMEAFGFFDAPASTRYHLCEEGGLAEHSLNVFRVMDDLAICLFGKKHHELLPSIVICSLLHDIGKIGQFGKKNYVEKFVRSKSKNKVTGEYDMVRSTAEPFQSNPNLAYIPHEVRSLEIVARFIDLTEDEAHAIYYHNGKYTHIGNDLKERPLQMLLHFADMVASRIIENETYKEWKQSLPFVTVGEKRKESE